MEILKKKSNALDTNSDAADDALIFEGGPEVADTQKQYDDITIVGVDGSETVLEQKPAEAEIKEEPEKKTEDTVVESVEKENKEVISMADVEENEYASAFASVADEIEAFAPTDYAEAEKEYKSRKGNSAFIEFRNIKKTYKMGETEIKALDGIDFTINRGEFVIVVGASGAGKSTILNILGGMDKQTSGQIFVDGAEVSSYTDKQMIMYRRYDVGFVFQFYNLVQNLTAKENVELATQISKDPLDVDATMQAVGLSNRSKNFPSQLSGGEQQRVAVARALAKNPKLLLCDEPTGALDYNTGKAILKLLQDTARKNGMTVIIITHNYALTEVGDRVIQVKNGHIESITTNDHPMDIDQVEW